ncbi:MFS transporter [Vallicoccus soli]|uniref:MFS transporter n=1 Tax=Vallicoccus soli TaxID=2339232 RepID=A0A3A3Z1R2_9ACTN|nr:MFS transporter [Vallicoccus soli]RJK94337.1 MFS transporter [Vallicoccus soli]
MSFAGDLRDVLRGRDFRRLYATRLSSQFADGVLQVALASLFFFSPERQTTAGGIAAAFTVLLLPYSLVGPFAGVLLDRWRRRQVLVRANLLRAAMVLGVAVLIALDVEGPVLYLAVLACLSVNRFFLAGLSASLPHVVPRHELVMANAVTPTSGTVAALLGGGAGYLLVAALGGGDAADAQTAVVAALAYAGSALVARTMHPDLLGPDPDEGRPATREALRHVASGFLDGARHVRSHPRAAHALAAIGGHRFCYGVSTFTVILLYRNHFNPPQDVQAGLGGLAAAVSASGLGFFTAALVTPWVTARVSKQAWVTACLLLAGAVQAVYLVRLDEVLVVLGAFLLGVSAQGSKICVDTLVQESVDDAFRGRVFSLYDVLFNVAFVAAAGATALVLPPSGVSAPVVLAVALGYAGTGLAYARASRRWAARVPTA